MRVERDIVVGRVRRRGWSQVGFGLYRRDATGDERLGDLLAWQQILPPSGCLTHLTAAALHGLWLPPLPDGLPVLVSMSKSQSRPKRPELKVMRHTQPIRTVRMGGLVVATVEEALLTCARDLSILDLVVLGDAALQMGLTSRDRLLASASRRRWGSERLISAVGWMDGRSESAWESLLRVLHVACGIVVVPQYNVEHEGCFVARGDLRLEGTKTLHEFDGGVHRDPATHRRDLDRDRRLLAAGWSRRGYVAADVLGRPERILRDADLTLGRPHRVDRLDPWLRLVGVSLFDPLGPARLEQRLRGPERRKVADRDTKQRRSSDGIGHS